MMVIFISRSEKKALYTVRSILDNFAERIGNDTWRTIITEDGLDAVYAALRRSATKNTAVSCHWIRSRTHSELLWIVGKKNAFSISGTVPVNHTSKNLNHMEWENDWPYMPYMKAIVALSALCHDWGKASDFFQAKLHNPNKSNKTADRYRHEFVSCKIIEAIIAIYGDANDDIAWLKAITEDRVEEEAIIKYLKMEYINARIDKFNANLPKNAKLIMWLILSHHRLPNLEKEGRASFKNVELSSIDMAFTVINSKWGYSNEKRKDIKESEENTVSFSNGLLINNETVWHKEVKKWAGRLINVCSNTQIEQAERSILYYSRLVLMLSDHYISSMPAKDSKADVPLWANTCDTGMKQSLVEHLLGVNTQALQILYQLPLFFDNMEKAENVKQLRKNSPGKFSWQDKAVQEIVRAKGQDDNQKAFFTINMASTGCGKTIANAKIVNAMSEDNALRYVLALGLRSLTLQTGDEYKSKIGLKENELAVIIGSKAVSDLHDMDNTDNGSESADNLVEYELGYLNDINPDQKKYLDIFFKGSLKNKALLLKPVLVTTIDHIMGASESIKGGHQILPGLRLMSSDLVIDEIDDFNVTDLTAIARLVHLAGMMGRNVIISSATIPPDLAEGLYHTYSDGLSCYNQFHSENKRVITLWCDEFKSVSKALPQNDNEVFRKCHKEFIKNRIAKLNKQPTNRSSYIVDFPLDMQHDDIEKEYFNKIKCETIKLHNDNYIIDKKSNKRISFGIIRMANIDPCVNLGKYLMECDWESDYQAFIMCYHSRQILLLRHVQEKYLDSVMKRKDENPLAADIDDDILRKHIDDSSCKNILFILVATPVEEVGRDHDFDWAVIEPSSFRSVIQMAGRVRRHRTLKNDYPHKNIAIMQYNLKGINGAEVAYEKPGFEDKTKHKLSTHDMKEIAGKYLSDNKIDAAPRIQVLDALNPSMDMVHLEHQVMREFNSWDVIGPETMHGWDNEYWWLTGLPQNINRFRESRPQKILYAIYDGEVNFYEYDKGIYVPVTELFKITLSDIDLPEIQDRSWLHRNYIDSLKQYIDGNVDDEQLSMEMNKVSKRYGEISLPDNSSVGWLYNDQYGMVKLKRK